MKYLAIDELDDGISGAVIALRRAGIDTFSSCQGGGPLTGDPIQDLAACPGCAALSLARSAIAKAKGEA